MRRLTPSSSSVADDDHAGGWVKSTEVLPHVLPFTAAET
jgi:hypothetical protein